jgi:23S rRNA pseudouridine2457 synthase
VVIDGDKTLPAQAELISYTPLLPERSVPIRFRKNIPTAWLKLTLCEGKNRQVRRMTAAIGCPTLRLMRVAIGRLDLFSLAIQPGEWLNLSAEQVASLFEPASKSLRIPKTQV